MVLQQLADDKLENAKKHRETLEVRIASLEEWQSTFKVETSMNFSKMRTNENLKYAELRERISE